MSDRPDESGWPVFLTWSIKESFVDYVRKFGEVATQGSAVDAPTGFRFPLVDRSDDGVHRFEGAVSFTAHSGLLSLTISDPWLVPTASGSTLTVCCENERRSIADLADAVSATGDDGVYPATLAESGAVLFDFTYRVGEKLAPVRLETVVTESALPRAIG